MAKRGTARRNGSGRVIGATGLAAMLERATSAAPPSIDVADEGVESPRARARREREEMIRRVTTVKPETDGYPGTTPIEEEDEEWSAELPPPDPADIDHALSNSLSAREVEEADLDRLWDWIRADEDKGKAFLGVVPATSSEMRATLQVFGELYALVDSGSFVTADGTTLSREGLGMDAQEHIGVAGFQQLQPTYMMAHLYLAPQARGHAARLIPQLLRMAEETFPGQTFVVQTEDSAMARMLKSIGFTASFLLKWVPSPATLVAPEETLPDADGDWQRGEGAEVSETDLED